MCVDLIVIDVIMSGFDGLSWVKVVCVDWLDILVIFVLGYVDGKFGEDCLSIENLMFLLKLFLFV